MYAHTHARAIHVSDLYIVILSVWCCYFAKQPDFHCILTAGLESLSCLLCVFLVVVTFGHWILIAKKLTMIDGLRMPPIDLMIISDMYRSEFPNVQ